MVTSWDCLYRSERSRTQGVHLPGWDKRNNSWFQRLKTDERDAVIVYRRQMWMVHVRLESGVGACYDRTLRCRLMPAQIRLAKVSTVSNRGSTPFTLFGSL